MKRIMLICMVLIFSFSAFGQEETTRNQRSKSPDPKVRQERIINRMKEALDLSDVQTEKINAIMVERLEKGKKDFEAMCKEREELLRALKEMRKANMEAMREKEAAFQKEVKAILTPEQSEKYEQYLLHRRRRMKAHRHHPNRNKGRRPVERRRRF